MSYKVSLPLFEGPFDLLVYLIENARMNIYDIQISEITEQYLAYLEKMQEQDVAVAADFMVLAATLIDIKARMILPRNQDLPPDEAEPDPRSELVERLLEYKRYKELAAVLGERAEKNALIYEKPQEDISVYLENPDIYLSLTVENFVSAFELFLQKERRVAEVKAHYQRIEREKASIESRIVYIRDRLQRALRNGLKKLSLRDLIPNKKDKYDVIVTFASLLQMMKEHLADAEQRSTYGEIFVKPQSRARKEAEDVQ
ncbi:MAG: segregation/condensation protein A [Clostridia bacterium]|nr:segregation/condensation protein A [Clostridia bacterium]